MIYSNCFILLLVLGKYLNYLRVRNATLRLQNKFTALNSELYILLESGKVSSDDKHFLFLSRSIEGSEKYLAKINFWIIVYSAYKRRNLQSGQYLKFEKESSNIELRKILNEYTKASSKYYWSKNYFAICSFFFLLKSLTEITRVIHKARGITFLKNFKRNFKFLLIVSHENFNLEPCFNNHNSQNFPVK